MSGAFGAGAAAAEPVSLGTSPHSLQHAGIPSVGYTVPSGGFHAVACIGWLALPQAGWICVVSCIVDGGYSMVSVHKGCIHVQCLCLQAWA